MTAKICIPIVLLLVAMLAGCVSTAEQDATDPAPALEWTFEPSTMRQTEARAQSGDASLHLPPGWEAVVNGGDHGVRLRAGTTMQSRDARLYSTGDLSLSVTFDYAWTNERQALIRWGGPGEGFHHNTVYALTIDPRNGGTVEFLYEDGTADNIGFWAEPGHELKQGKHTITMIRDGAQQRVRIIIDGELAMDRLYEEPPVRGEAGHFELGGSVHAGGGQYLNGAVYHLAIYDEPIPLPAGIPEPSAAPPAWDEWLASGPVAAWRMEASDAREGGTIDRAAGRLLQFVGKPTHVEDVAGGGYQLGNGNYLQTADEALALDEALTLFMRIAWHPTDAEKMLAQWQHEAPGRQALYRLSLAGDSSKNVLAYAHDTWMLDTASHTSRTPLEDDVVDILVVRDPASNSLRVWANGLLVIDAPEGPARPIPVLGQLTVGADPQAPAAATFGGIVYELWLWDSATNPAAKTYQ